MILEAAEENIHIIKSKFSNNVTNKNKIQIWEDIAERVNAIGVCKRSVMEIKDELALKALKNQLANASMMAFSVKEASTEVVTDASPVGLGGILVQEKQGVKRAVAFASRSLSDVERRYSQSEKEALAVVWACERFHLYLTGLPSFQLVTDCKALEAIYGPRSKPSARVERWVLRLMPFKYTVRHVTSGQNIADCLIRLTKIPASPRDGVTEEYVQMRHHER